jgi:TetR/AcrR family transcriptional regulator, tetracycline repressor protein
MPSEPGASRSESRGHRAAGRRDPRGPRSAPLSRDLIVRTALRIVDTDGLAALSMRRLGAELGVDPMAVYYHVPSKDALLDSIVEAVMSDIDLSADDTSASTEDRVVSASRAYLQAMLAHGNALPIVLTRGPSTPAAMRPVELLMSILRDGGLSPLQAMAGMNAIAAAVRGVAGMVASSDTAPPTREEMEALAEQFPADEFPNLREAAMCGPDYLGHDFEFGVRAMARGLVASANAADDRPGPAHAGTR